jgi:hypothetical protein
MAKNFPFFENRFEELRIFILGSYFPPNFQILKKLQINLIKKGFSHTYLGNELVDIESIEQTDKNQRNYYSSMLQGRLGIEKLCVYKYHNEADLNQKAYYFILQNLNSILLKRIN